MARWQATLTKAFSPSPAIPSSVSKDLSLNVMLSLFRRTFRRDIVCECIYMCAGAYSNDAVVISDWHGLLYT